MASRTKKAPSRRRISFKLDAAQAGEVFLAGDFNGWDRNKHPMTMGKDGRWVKTLVLAPGRYSYKFIVDGEWMRDPLNPEVEENPFGSLNSVVVVD
jgi:1,4-alpha-glucan branching enzyme